MPKPETEEQKTARKIAEKSAKAACCTRAASLHTELCTALKRSCPAPDTDDYCFRFPCKKENFHPIYTTYTHVSVSVPPNASGNRGPGDPYNEPEIPIMFETALFYNERIVYRFECGYDDVCRFVSVAELVTELRRLGC